MRRTLVSRSSREKPRPFDRWVRTTSPSSRVTVRSPASRAARLRAIVDLPDPDSPVNSTTRTAPVGASTVPTVSSSPEVYAGASAAGALGRLSRWDGHLDDRAGDRPPGAPCGEPCVINPHPAGRQQQDRVRRRQCADRQLVGDRDDDGSCCGGVRRLPSRRSQRGQVVAFARSRRECLRRRRRPPQRAAHRSEEVPAAPGPAARDRLHGGSKRSRPRRNLRDRAAYALQTRAAAADEKIGTRG